MTRARVWLPHRSFKSDLFKRKKTAFFKPFFYAPLSQIDLISQINQHHRALFFLAKVRVLLAPTDAP